MGVSFSCSSYDALDENFEALLRTIALEDDEDGDRYGKSHARSVSFNGRGSEPAGAGILKAWGSGKLVIKGYFSFNRRDRKDPPFHVETKFSIRAGPSSETKSETSAGKQTSFKRTRFGASSDRSADGVGSPKHEAAVRLQKVYRSFRTRRQLADCAVLVEQRWWKLIDFALLRRSSVSFFDIERPESAISKWTRAKSRAAKVGKGLSKDEKAQKLALQHWLEAIDPRHRYGHNLHFYYDRWLRCASRQPFFYWLDIGEGREISVEEKCPRTKLHQQCIKYLGPKEREDYEVIVEDGKFLYKKSGQVLDTSSQGANDSKWIFVLSTSKTLYVGQKRKGKFQHSSFLAGGATSAAGRLEVENGILKAVWPHSGHYRPTEENFQEFVNFLKENNVDLTDVKESPIGEEEELWSKVRAGESEEGQAVDTNDAALKPEEVESKASGIGVKKDFAASEERYMFRKPNLFVEEERPSVPRELILRRIDSKKGLKSLQLGQQLSFRWTTGAGPRIGCVRDYPSELQARALEEVSLSPRSRAGASRFGPSPGTPTPKLQEMKK